MKMNQLPVGLPDELRNWIKEQAAKRYISEAAYIRQLVIEEMQKEQAKEKKE